MVRARVLAALGAALVLGACGPASSPPPESPPPPAAAPAARASAEPEWEGFYDVTAVDDAWLAARGIPLDASALGRARVRLGKLILPSGEREASPAELDALEARYCSPGVRPWNEALCASLASRACEGEGEEERCRYAHFGNCSGFFLDGARFVTAAHCVHGLGPGARIVRMNEDGSPGASLEPHGVRAGKEDFDHHWVAVDEEAPFDAAILSVDDQGLPAWEVGPVPARGEPVFLLGFPRAERRSAERRRAVGYELVFGTPSVSFGRVLDRNEARAPLCNVDGDQEHWGLAAECPVGDVVLQGEATWRGPLTMHPFLTSYDTVNGFSGGPVFDAHGRLVGVNSTLVGTTDPQDAYGDHRSVAVVAEAALSRLASTVERPLAR